MAVDTKLILKTYFETGDIPEQWQFENLIDSLKHVSDGGKAYEVSVTVPTGQIQGKTTFDIPTGFVLSRIIVTTAASSGCFINLGDSDGTGEHINGEEITVELPFQDNPEIFANGGVRTVHFAASYACVVHVWLV